MELINEQLTSVVETLCINCLQTHTLSHDEAEMRPYYQRKMLVSNEQFLAFGSNHCLASRICEFRIKSGEIRSKARYPF